MVGGGSAGIADQTGVETAFESGGDEGRGDQAGHPHLIEQPPTSGANCRYARIGRSVAERRVDDGKYASSSAASRYEGC